MKKSDLRRLIQNSILEVTIKDLRGEAPDFLNVRNNSKQLEAEYLGIEDDIINFRVKSQYTDEYYYQQVKLLDLKKLIKKYKDKYKPRQIVNSAIKGNILIHCDDPSWKYWGFQYKATEGGYALEKEVRPAHIRNPHKKGSLCKHLDLVLVVLPFYVSDITGELKKNGYFS